MLESSTNPWRSPTKQNQVILLLPLRQSLAPPSHPTPLKHISFWTGELHPQLKAPSALKVFERSANLKERISTCSITLNSYVESHIIFPIAIFCQSPPFSNIKRKNINISLEESAYQGSLLVFLNTAN